MDSLKESIPLLYSVEGEVDALFERAVHLGGDLYVDHLAVLPPHTGELITVTGVDQLVTPQLQDGKF